MKKNILLFFVVFVFQLQIFAQQDSQYTNYMYNPSVINPGYAGTRDALSIFGLYRTQWVGLDGAPETGNFALHTPLRNSNIGLGLSFVNDRIGPSDESTLSLDVAYRIPVNDNSTLSFGVKGTANLLNVDYTKLDPYNNEDPLLANNIDNRFSPNIGAGVYWYSDKHYIGFSVPNILETKYYDDNISTLASERAHFYLMGGYVFDLGENTKLKPATLIKAVQGAPLQVDVTANIMFNETVVLGAAYRWDAALSALLGFQINEKLFIGYTYDMETTRLANYNSGSHEIFLRFELFNRVNRVYSPRFF
ncbi:MAG: type IX secretion system membrane protein PorP/SprF [Flavobacteriaceae bacterium]